MNGILSVGCGLLVLIASAAFGQEVTDDEWYVFIIKGADGRVHKAKRPGKDAVCFPLFFVDDTNWEEKDAASELKPVKAKAALAGELDRYGMRAFACDFDGETWFCLMYSPKDSSRQLPMIVHIPGIGEIGDDLKKQFNQRRIFDIVLAPEFQKRHPCHLLALSPPASLDSFCGSVAGTANRPQRRANILVHKAAELKGDCAAVDTNRLYITGFSFGGDGAIRVAMAYPGVYAAVLPVAAVVPPVDFVSENHPGNYWCVCNDGDGVAKGDAFEAVQDLKECVNRLGGDFRVSVYPSTKGHDAWNSAWGEDAIWEWVFSKRLDTAGKSRKAVVAERTEESVPLGDAVCSSTVSAADEVHDEKRPLDGLARTYFEPSAAFARDDWWQVELKEPVAGRVLIVTGDASGKRLLKSGYVELSGNGRTWRRGGGFSKDSGRSEFWSQSQFRLLRVRSNQGRNPFVIRQLQIFRK